jgi:hypothetical protein
VAENKNINKKIKRTINIAGYTSNDVIIANGISEMTLARAPNKKKFFLDILPMMRPITYAPNIPSSGTNKFKKLDILTSLPVISLKIEVE